MVDIKELMRTYVFINDPNVKEVTTKFGVALLALGVVGIGVAGVVTMAEDDSPAETQASEADGGSGGELATNQTRDCVQEEDADEWRQDNADVLLSNRLISEEASGDWVCFIYTE